MMRCTEIYRMRDGMVLYFVVPGKEVMFIYRYQ